MTILAQDNFDTDTAGALPPGWVNAKGTWAVGTSRPVSGTQSFGSSAEADGDIAIYTGATAVADMQVDTSQVLATAAGAYPLISHILRSDASGQNHYAVLFSQVRTTGFTVFLFKRTSGTYTSQGSQAVSMTLAAGDIVRVRSKIIGSAITLYIGRNAEPSSTPIASFTNTLITAAGYCGLYYSKESVAAMAIDNFVLSDGVASAVVLPGAPTIGTATAGAGTGAVTFTPGTTGSNPTTSYLATASTGETASGTSSPIAFGSLSAGVARTIHVQGVSSDGPGPASAESNSITPTSSSDATAPTLTGGVTLGTPGSTSIPISYPAGADNVAVAGYEYSIDSGASYVSVGNITSPTIAGLTAATTYPAVRVRAFDAAGNRSTPYIASASGFTTAAASGFAGVLFSPYNWDVQAGFAKTINAGAYFKTIFGGTLCVLNFDMTGIATPVPQLTYQVDRFGPVITVPLAATITITVPTDTSGYASKPGHFLEVRVKSMTETQPRWSTQATAVKLTSITLDSGKTLTAPPSLPTSLLFYGDSITEGVRTVNSTATSDTDRNDSGQCWSLEVGRILGAEVGNVGFGGSGFNVIGSGSVPTIGNSYNLLYAGVARSFAASPTAIVLMEGTNDSSDVTGYAVTLLNGLIAATTSKIIVLRPFNGTLHASQLQAAIAACSTPSRCAYVDTAGFFTVVNSSDNLHPYGVENLTHIAPLVANAIRPLLVAGAPALSSRTVTMTLNLGRDSNNNLIPAANLNNIQVSAFDDPTRPAGGVIRYQSATGTTNSAGVLTFTYQSSLATGGICGVDLILPDKSNMAVNVAVT